MQECEILIKNGIVIQPSINYQGKAHVLIKNGCVSDVLKEHALSDVHAPKVIDATGCYVIPGLIDFHTHLFNGGSEIGINPDAFLLPQGVTAAVDQGTSGIANVDSFFKDIIASSETKVFAYINVSSSGLTTLPRCLENLNPEKFDKVKLNHALIKYKDHVQGIKIRTSKEIVGEYGYEPLKRAREIADDLGCSMVVHTTNPPGILDELISFFKSGDVYAHMYQGRDNPIISSDGSIEPCILAARERGVIFDSADGRDHFRFNVIKKAFQQGFYPDVISTDLVRGNVFDKAVFGLPLVMSKYINLGMPLIDVVKATTCTPAQILGREHSFGTLLPGTTGDITILKLKQLNIEMRDVFGDKLLCKDVLVNQMTIVNGRVVFEQLEFTNNVSENR